MGNCNHKKVKTLRVIHQADGLSFRTTITEDRCLNCKQIIRHESREGVLSGHLYYKKKIKCEHEFFTIDTNANKFAIGVCDECKSSFHCYQKQGVWFIKKSSGQIVYS